jgi:hypothetical protein
MSIEDRSREPLTGTPVSRPPACSCRPKGDDIEADNLTRVGMIGMIERHDGEGWGACVAGGLRVTRSAARSATDGMTLTAWGEAASGIVAMGARYEGPTIARLRSGSMLVARS